MTTLQDEVLDLEKKFWAGDPSFYNETMDDGVLVLMEPMGFVPKDKAVEMAGQSGGWSDLKMHDVHVVELTPECAAVAYHGEAKGADGKPQRSAVASTYVRRGGRWRLAMTSHQPWPTEDATR